MEERLKAQGVRLKARETDSWEADGRKAQGTRRKAQGRKS